jgi:hypothetical protein
MEQNNKALQYLKTDTLFADSKNDTITMIINQKELKLSLESLYQKLIIDQKA